MERLQQFINNIESFIKAQEKDEMKDLLKVFPELEEVLDILNKYEDELRHVLKRSKEEVIKEFRALVEGTTDNPAVLNQMYSLISSDLAETASISSVVAKLSKVILTHTCEALTSIVMSEIDADTAFKKLSPRTLRWIDSWSKELGDLMDVTNHKAVSGALAAAIKEGEGIEATIRRLETLPEFDRNRARATAVTEILTANSRSQWEAYNQSPVVSGKRWLHSGGSKIRPRPAHVALSGKVVGADEDFIVNGYPAQFPRDTRLPAKERVYCHCTMSPVVDEEILFQPKEYKKLLHERNLNNMQ